MSNVKSLKVKRHCVLVLAVIHNSWKQIVQIFLNSFVWFMLLLFWTRYIWEFSLFGILSRSHVQRKPSPEKAKSRENQVHGKPSPFFGTMSGSWFLGNQVHLRLFIFWDYDRSHVLEGLTEGAWPRNSIHKYKYNPFSRPRNILTKKQPTEQVVLLLFLGRISFPPRWNGKWSERKQSGFDDFSSFLLPFVQLQICFMTLCSLCILHQLPLGNWRSSPN